MPRSKWKVSYTDAYLRDTVYTYLREVDMWSHQQGSSGKLINKPILKTLSRNANVMSFMVGLLIYVHNGRKFIPVRIKKSMVGRKLGEFSTTKRVVVHKKTKKK